MNNSNISYRMAVGGPQGHYPLGSGIHPWNWIRRILGHARGQEPAIGWTCSNGTKPRSGY